MRHSRIAMLALPCGIALWPLLMLSGAVPAVCEPEVLDSSSKLMVLVPIATLMPLVAILLGAVAALRIKLSRDQLRGRWSAQLGITLGVMSLLMLIAIPRFLIFQERGVQERAFRSVERAQERYRARYPELGYSPDLRSLGPPPAGTPTSTRHADLLNPELQAGLYCHGKEPLTYAPRADSNGKIVGYGIQIGSHGVTHVRDETGKTSTTIDPAL